MKVREEETAAKEYYESIKDRALILSQDNPDEWVVRPVWIDAAFLAGIAYARASEREERDSLVRRLKEIGTDND